MYILNNHEVNLKNIYKMNQNIIVYLTIFKYI